MTVHWQNGFIAIAAIAAYLLGMAIHAGLFKRVTGEDCNGWGILFWPVLVSCYPLLGFLWLCAKAYEWSAGAQK